MTSPFLRLYSSCSIVFAISKDSDSPFSQIDNDAQQELLWKKSQFLYNPPPLLCLPQQTIRFTTRIWCPSGRRWWQKFASVDGLRVSKLYKYKSSYVLVHGPLLLFRFIGPFKILSLCVHRKLRNLWMLSYSFTATMSSHYSRVLWLSCPLGFIYANFNAQLELMECLPCHWTLFMAEPSRVMCYNGESLLRQAWVGGVQ